ncbi:MAG: hypothetical protein IIY21_10920 [Clostridiales bacterium]|nr:hypothetical protein [Clostridiales bacterium]MBQ1571180.1 hypothetical protein [Clostridiales bacterium]
MGKTIKFDPDREVKHKLNRKQRRKVHQMAKAASREAMRRLDEGIENIYKASYNVSIRYTDDDETS